MLYYFDSFLDGYYLCSVEEINHNRDFSLYYLTLEMKEGKAV
jgi:hypothetical protein